MAMRKGLRPYYPTRKYDPETGRVLSPAEVAKRRAEDPEFQPRSVTAKASGPTGEVRWNRAMPRGLAGGDERRISGGRRPRLRVEFSVEIEIR